MPASFVVTGGSLYAGAPRKVPLRVQKSGFGWLVLERGRLAFASHAGLRTVPTTSPSTFCVTRPSGGASPRAARSHGQLPPGHEAVHRGLRGSSAPLLVRRRRSTFAAQPLASRPQQSRDGGLDDPRREQLDDSRGGALNAGRSGSSAFSGSPTKI